jgi:Na+-driven multidrug efflux pump
MDKNELYRLIQQKEKEYDRAPLKRFVFTVLGYGVVFCAALLWLHSDDITIFSFDGLLEIGGAYLAGVFIAGFFVTFSAPVFHWLYESTAREKRILEDLKKQLNDMDKKQP